MADDLETTPRQARSADTPQPTGYTSPLTSPLARVEERGGNRVQLEYMAERLAEIRSGGDVLATYEDLPEEARKVAKDIGAQAGALQRMARALAAGLLGLAVLGGVLFAPGSTPGAEAMAYPSKTRAALTAEAPQPDPVAQTVRVVLGAAPVTVRVRATVYTETAPGWRCASVWTARGRIGGGCSSAPTFTIPVRIDPRTFPVGRTFAQVVDDAADVAVGNVTLDARRPSRFGVGYFEDRGQGDLYVQVPVTLYSPTLGRWVPQVQSPVQVQELTRRGWRVRATLTTNPPGLAVGIVHFGGGRHVIRAVRPDGATVWGTTGRNRLVTVTTEPLNVD